MAQAEFKGEEYVFPDEQEEVKEVEVAEDKVEIEIEDDTPPEDRNRKPMKEPVEEVTDDELNNYDEKVQARIKKFTRGYHCLLYTSPSPRDGLLSRMPSSA